jgi:hypothetical protein
VNIKKTIIGLVGTIAAISLTSGTAIARDAPGSDGNVVFNNTSDPNVKLVTVGVSNGGSELQIYTNQIFVDQGVRDTEFRYLIHMPDGYGTSAMGVVDCLSARTPSSWRLKDGTFIKADSRASKDLLKIVCDIAKEKQSREDAYLREVIGR